MQGTTTNVMITNEGQSLKTGVWTHGLFGCFDNLSVCIITYFVPCVTFGQTRERLHGDGCILYGCLYAMVPFAACFLETSQRGEIRARRGIDGSCCGDFMAVLCCPLCTLVQEEQEAIALQQQQMGHTGTTVVIQSSGVPPPGQQYPPPGQQYPQGQPQYPPPGQQYPPPGQQYPPPGQQYPPPAYPNQEDMTRK